MKRAIELTQFVVTAALEVMFRLLNLPNLVFGSPETTKELVVAAVEHADTVLIAAALVDRPLHALYR